MLSGTSQIPLPSQLSELAQRLRDLRLRVGDGTANPSMCRGRSATLQLPVLRQPQAEAETEPTCSVADMSEVRTPNELPLKEANGGSSQINGTAPPSDLSGLAGDREGDASKPGDRENRHWEGDGAERDPTAEGSDRECLHQHDVERVHGMHGLCPGPQGPSGERCDHELKQKQGQWQEQAEALSRSRKQHFSSRRQRST